MQTGNLGMELSISENLVVHIWQSGIFPELVTTIGETIRDLSWQVYPWAGW